MESNNVLPPLDDDEFDEIDVDQQNNENGNSDGGSNGANLKFLKKQFSTNSPDVLRVPRENKAYYASCLSGGVNINANIGGLAINSPDVSKISIPGDVTNPLAGSPGEQPEINLSGSGG